MDRTKLLASIKAARGSIEARKASGIGTVTVPAGESRWRILPGWRSSNPELFHHDFGRHWIKDMEGNVLATYVCDRDTFGKHCDICEALGEAIRSTKDDKALKALKEMGSRRRVLVNALLLKGGEKPDPNTPVLMEIPTSLWEDYIKLFETRAADDIFILDPEEGRDIIIKREGTGLTTRYSLTDAPKNTGINTDVLTRLVNIDAYIEAERNKGNAKGVAPLNEQIRERLKLPSGAVRGATLLGGTAGSITGITSSPAPALEAPRRVLEVEPVVEVAGVEDQELAALLKSLDD